MNYVEERRRITAEVFAATGKKCAEDDPIIVAALFQAETIRAASREGAEQIVQAAQSVQAATDDTRKAAVNAEVSVQRAVANAATIAQLAAADRQAFAQAAATTHKALADSIEARVKKAIREAGRVHSTQGGPPQGWAGVFAGVALGIFIAAGAMLAACNFRLSWFADARLGAELNRVLPSIDPDVRDKFIEQFNKHRH